MTTTDEPGRLDTELLAAPPRPVPDAVVRAMPAPPRPRLRIPEPAPPDWTALLPAGRLGAVVVLGPLTASARAALAAGMTPAKGERPDTVVVTRDSRRSVTRALALLAPGGTLRVEPSSRRRRTALVRRLRRSGFTVSTWWHRPTVARARCLVCLDDPAAAATIVRTVADRGRWVKVEALLARSGGARLGAGEVSLMARAPGGPTDGDLATAQPDDGGTLDGLVTPRFSSSRAVIGVSTRDGGRHLDRVAKVARRPTDDVMIIDEAAHLDDLLRRTGPFPGAPARPSVVVRGSRSVLIEDAVDGRPLDRRAVRRDPLGALAAGRRWIEGLPIAAATRPAEDGRAEELISRSLSAISTGTGHRAVRRAEVAGRAGVLLAPLVAERLPVVFEHGDLSHPNVMCLPDGSLGVVDWERARPKGLPVHDLTSFVTYVVESVEQPDGPVALAEVVGRALQPHGWAWPEVAAHTERLGVARRLVPLLVLASWTRRVAALGPARPSPSRDEVLWMAAVVDLEERRR